MSDAESIQSLKAAKEAISAAIKNIIDKKPYSAIITIDNAMRCLKSSKNKMK